MRFTHRLWASFLAVCFLSILFGSASLFALCTLNTQNQTVTICTPAPNATVSSPVNVQAGVTDSNAVKTLQIYVDGVKVYDVVAKTLNTNVNMANGAHRLTVQAQDSTGAIFKSTENINVSTAGAGSINDVKHIIFMVEENRSFDSYFGMMGAYRQKLGYGGTFNGVPLNASLSDYQATGNVSPFHYQTVCTDNMTPAWNESHYSWHAGKMDYFMKVEGSLPSSIDPQGTRIMGYYDQTDLPYYYELATQYATSDTWHTPILSDTIPSRMYLFTATSFGHIRPQDVPPSGGWPQATIFRNLSQHGITWRYYYQDNSVYLASFSDWNSYQGNVYNISHYYTDIQNPSTLPEVIFIERGSQTGVDEHPLNNIQKGAADVANIINSFLKSPSYSSSVFILTYDDPGGLYDHVPPFSEPAPDSIPPMLRSGDIAGNFAVSGFRVPLIVVSPWTKPHYVSHVNRDYTAIHKFIEKRFGLPALTARDAAQDDMTEMFNFATVQIPTPPAMPIQPTSGVCNKNLEKAPGY